MMYKNLWKRVLDVVLALLALPFVAIAVAVFAPIVHFTDKGPAFYNAQRLGKDGKPYMNAYINARDVDLCGAPQKEN